MRSACAVHPGARLLPALRRSSGATARWTLPVLLVVFGLALMHALPAGVSLTSSATLTQSSAGVRAHAAQPTHPCTPEPGGHANRVCAAMSGPTATDHVLRSAPLGPMVAFMRADPVLGRPSAVPPPHAPSPPDPSPPDLALLQVLRI